MNIEFHHVFFIFIEQFKNKSKEAQVGEIYRAPRVSAKIFFFVERSMIYWI